jgi:hypothetical protein
MMRKKNSLETAISGSVGSGTNCRLAIHLLVPVGTMGSYRSGPAVGKGEPADEPGDDRFEARLLLSLPAPVHSDWKAFPSPLSVTLI